MAARPGEESISTLFADVHYFYGNATDKPRHHRFDKGSYVYLFENAGERRARLEIANAPGTDDQDAFHGHLDRVHVRFSYKQHAVVTLTLGNVPDDPHEWHLPTYDPRNENKYHYKLQSLDIYFWTHQDALQFVNNIRRILPTAQVEVLDEPVAPPPSMPTAFPPPPPPNGNSLVQKLEKAALDDTQPAQSQSFTPMAYNPAAPVAPEQVRHREKTPPPDDDPANPLAVAVAKDYQQSPFTPSFPPTQHPIPGMVSGAGFPPVGSGPSIFNSRPPQGYAPLARSATMPHQASPPYSSQPGASFPPPPPGLPPQAPKPSPSPAPAAPVQPQQPAQASQDEYAIHQQVYQPAKEEKATNPAAPRDRGRLDENAKKLERSVSGMFRKLEKKFG